jgi:antibiotic biosynthesis monooxygenase (ABM) superfamily enzyme
MLTAPAITFAESIKYLFKKIISMKTKMKLIAAFKIWVVIYPSITLFYYLFGQQLSVMPLYQRTFLLTISLVPLIVFVGVPFVDSLIRQVSKKSSRAK